ncbi:hypothetical protein GGTG_02322 [Gaeumannomyces tritici R3-111a-1]|uniref:Uncharacterized protein n=1 Tax=Gaeumannomyces tritici (strain R3-111a-1) TaxID=644352 RepID=J3NM18_GAET3|nr:hypothetical protein GGTG_02322 [Gaeumannomyces tritici R3-111a-1]EJT82349.1 hypothetical protein GGTG_02322 [Gaeumannomyces tritici R3-111a-1]
MNRQKSPRLKANGIAIPKANLSANKAGVSVSGAPLFFDASSGFLHFSHGHTRLPSGIGTSGAVAAIAAQLAKSTVESRKPAPPDRTQSPIAAITAVPMPTKRRFQGHNRNAWNVKEPVMKSRMSQRSRWGGREGKTNGQLAEEIRPAAGSKETSRREGGQNSRHGGSNANSTPETSPQMTARWPPSDRRAVRASVGSAAAVAAALTAARVTTTAGVGAMTTWTVLRLIGVREPRSLAVV